MNFANTDYLSLSVHAITIIVGGYKKQQRKTLEENDEILEVRSEAIRDDKNQQVFKGRVGKISPTHENKICVLERVLAIFYTKPAIKLETQIF